MFVALILYSFMSRYRGIVANPGAYPVRNQELGGSVFVNTKIRDEKNKLGGD